MALKIDILVPACETLTINTRNYELHNETEDQGSEVFITAGTDSSNKTSS